MDFERDLYDYIFNHAFEGIFQSTPDGRYMRVNKTMAEIYGYASPQEMVDSVKNIAKQIYVSPQDRARFRSAIEAAGSVENFEGRNYRKD